MMARMFWGFSNLSPKYAKVSVKLMQVSLAFPSQPDLLVRKLATLFAPDAGT